MYINIYIYIRRPLFRGCRRPLFRGCHQAAEQQCSSYRPFYVMTVYFPSLIADCLMLTGIHYGQKAANPPSTLVVTWIPGSQ